jgi:peptide/nickel transport system permease protein
MAEATTELGAPELSIYAKPPSRTQRLRDMLALVTASRVATVGALIVLFWVAVAIFAGIDSLRGYQMFDPYGQNPEAINSGPSQENLLGADDLGRDLLARVIHGSALVLALSPVSVFCSLFVGSALGLTAGYFGGFIDEFVMRILDAMMAFPTILLYMIIIAAVGPSALNVVLAITIGGTPGIARMVRGLTLDIRTRDYVRAAELRGENPLYIMFVEILPNARGPIIVDAMLRVGYAVFAIGALGFLGLGVPPPSPDWGSMVARARSYILLNPWAVVWPALAISSLVVGLNLFADGIREESLRYQ